MHSSKNYYAMFKSLIRCVLFVFHFSEQSLVDLQLPFWGVLDWWGLWEIPKIKQFVYKSNRFQSCVKILIISK